MQSTVRVGIPLIPAPEEDRKDARDRAVLLRYRIRQLNTVLFAGAIVLVAGIVHVSVTHRLPGIFCDTACAEQLDSFVNLLSTSLGAIWTLVLLAVYVPATWIVHNDAHRVATDIPANDSHKKVSGWLADNGLSAALPGKLLRAGALLSPFLAGGPAGPLIQLLDTFK